MAYITYLGDKNHPNSRDWFTHLPQYLATVLVSVDTLLGGSPHFVSDYSSYEGYEAFIPRLSLLRGLTISMVTNHLRPSWEPILLGLKKPLKKLRKANLEGYKL